MNSVAPSQATVSHRVAVSRDRVTLRHRGSDDVTTKRRSNIRLGRFHCIRSAGARDRASDQVGSRTGPAEPYDPRNTLN
jgi:hypothetical protein